jgi:hypothetical protein
VYVGLKSPGTVADLNLAFWLPGTRSIEDVTSVRFRARISARPGARQYLSYRAGAEGTYFVQVRVASPGLARYRLTVVKG